MFSGLKLTRIIIVFSPNGETEMKQIACSLALVLLTVATTTQAQENDTERPFGPPPEVIAAWESGEGHLLPGPPAWVIEMRYGKAQEAGGMPPWVAARHARAAELGLPGPPTEVIEAWQKGEGESLPGPPDFVLDVLEMFGRGR
jgi:hypothetical protein